MARRRPPGQAPGSADGGSPPFRRLSWVQVAHAGGDALVAVALADTLFFSVPLGQARDKVGLYLALTMAPFAVLAPVVGPLIDRRRGAYRLAVVTAAFGRALLAGLLSSRTDRLELYPLAFGLLVLSRVHGVSRSALVPEVLPPGRSLIRANSWLAVVSVVGAAVGAGLAAGLNHLGGPDWSLWAAAGVFAASVVPALALPRGETGVVPAVARGWRVLLTPRLLAGGISMAANRGAVGFLTFFLAFLLRAGGERPAAYGAVLAAAGAGAFVGSVVAPALRAVLRESLLLLVSLGLMAGVALWVAAGDYGVPGAVAVAAAVGLGSGAGRLAFDSLLQRDAPESVRGRTFARYETIFQLAWVGGAALATIIPFRAAAGLRTLAAICLGGTALSLNGLLRTARR
jgi:hypothetical protein